MFSINSCFRTYLLELHVFRRTDHTSEGNFLSYSVQVLHFSFSYVIYILIITEPIWTELNWTKTLLCFLKRMRCVLLYTYVVMILVWKDKKCGVPIGRPGVTLQCDKVFLGEEMRAHFSKDLLIASGFLSIFWNLFGCPTFFVVFVVNLSQFTSLCDFTECEKQYLLYNGIK